MNEDNLWSEPQSVFASTNAAPAVPSPSPPPGIDPKIIWIAAGGGIGFVVLACLMYHCCIKSADSVKSSPVIAPDDGKLRNPLLTNSEFSAPPSSSEVAPLSSTLREDDRRVEDLESQKDLKTQGGSNRALQNADDMLTRMM